jgi:hypothetical protein
MRIRTQIGMLATLVLLTAAAGRPTTLARMSLDQLAAAADAVARVRCVGAESRWEVEGIWTRTIFDVLDTLKGSLPGRVVVRLPGGRVGHLTATVDATPKFTAGEEAYVFLERRPSGDFSLAAWIEGTFRISRDPHTGQETVTQDSSTTAVFDTASRRFYTEGIRRMSSERFRVRVAVAIARALEKTR